MKKKKKLICLILFPLLIATLTFMSISGCSEYDGEYYEVKYSEEFKEYLGISKINPDQEWGFENYNTRAKENKLEINGRIIVEDLLSHPSLKPRKSDWDYNDAVFDYNIQEDYTTITLLAAMGTIPIYIAEKEIHEAFGTFPSTIVDTRKQTQYQPVTWKFKTISLNPNDIPIYIKTPQHVYEITATKGHAPSKINVDQDFDWIDEGEHVVEKYPRFKDYAEKGEWKNNEWYR
jgi:hypothetical protein